MTQIDFTKHFLQQWNVEENHTKERDMCNLTEEQVEMFEETIDQFILDQKSFTGYDITRITRERENIRLRHADVAGSIHDLEVLCDVVEYGDYRKHSITSPNGGPVLLYYHKTSDPRDYKLGSNVEVGNQNELKPEGECAEKKGTTNSAYVMFDGEGNIEEASGVNPFVTEVPKINPIEERLWKKAKAEFDDTTTTSDLWDKHKKKDAPMVFDADDTEKEEEKPKKGEYKLDYRNRLQVPFIRLMTLKAKTGSTVYLLPNLSDENITISTESMDSMNEVSAKVDREGILISSKVLRSAGFLGNLCLIQNSTHDGNKVIAISEKK
jgi:hypothetical protein